MAALKWLKANNPLYANIAINDDWESEVLSDTTELFSGLIQHSLLRIMNPVHKKKVNLTKMMSKIWF